MYYTRLEDSLSETYGLVEENFSFTASDTTMFAQEGVIDIVPIEDLWITPTDLRSENEKLVFCPHPSIGHLLLDSLPLLFSWSKINPSHEIVVFDMSSDPGFYVPEHHIGYDTDGVIVLVEALRSSGATVHVVPWNEIILTNNFHLIKTINSTPPKTQNQYLLMQTLSDLILDSPQPPNKKVYVSRSELEPRPGTYELDTIHAITDDKRVFNEEYLDELFAEMGFEVVRPEQFKSMKKQVSVFRSARVIAGVTGAGLSNLMFTDPKVAGRLLFEIATPLVTQDPDNYEMAHLNFHNHYHDMSKMLEVEYACISALVNRDGKDVARRIRESNLYDYLSNY